MRLQINLHCLNNFSVFITHGDNLYLSVSVYNVTPVTHTIWMMPSMTEEKSTCVRLRHSVCVVCGGGWQQVAAMLTFKLLL